MVHGTDTQKQLERECEREHSDTGVGERARDKRGSNREGAKEIVRRGKGESERATERRRGEESQLYTTMNTHTRHTHTNAGTPTCVGVNIHTNGAYVYTYSERDRAKVSEKQREEDGERMEKEERKTERENDREKERETERGDRK
jgi:hypothetical protein